MPSNARRSGRGSWIGGRDEISKHPPRHPVGYRVVQEFGKTAPLRSIFHTSSSSILPSSVPFLDGTRHFSGRRPQIIGRTVQITRRQFRMVGRRLSIARRRVHFPNLAGRMANLTGQISSRKIHFSDGVSCPWVGRDRSPISKRRSRHSSFISPASLLILGVLFSLFSHRNRFAQSSLSSRDCGWLFVRA